MSCSVCHQIGAARLGERSSFTAGFELDTTTCGVGACGSGTVVCAPDGGLELQVAVEEAAGQPMLVDLVLSESSRRTAGHRWWIAGTNSATWRGTSTRWRRAWKRRSGPATGCCGM